MDYTIPVINDDPVNRNRLCKGRSRWTNFLLTIFSRVCSKWYSNLPKYISSIGSEGGIVSTAKESMIFLKAFINGHVFPKEYFNELQDWKILFSPGVFYMVLA